VTRTLVLTGEGRYADPWHPFEQTSAQLIEILEGLGHDVEVSTSIAERVGALDTDSEVARVDLIVANAASPEPALDPESFGRAEHGLNRYLGRGGAVFALHTSVTTLLDLPEWSRAIGGRWIKDVSMHPPKGPAQFSTGDSGHPIVGAISSFEADDERYSYLEVADDIDVLVTHDFEDRAHPVVWTHRLGESRIVADSLGHNVDSFSSPEHRELISRSFQWVAGEL
jgi:type 1 glutamine amidotransferase